MSVVAAVERKRLSYSQITCYKRCKKKWYFRYVLRLKTIHAPRPLNVGKLVHVGIGKFYANEDWREAMKSAHLENVETIEKAESLSDEEVIQYITEAEEHYEDAVGVVERYLEHDVTNPLLPEGWKVLAVEQEFLVEVDGAKDLLYGFIDMVVEDPDGNIWGVEHKSGEQFFMTEQLSLNEQTTMYLAVLKSKYGSDRVKGMIYNLIRTKKPSVPKLTKQGTMSKAAIDTTWDIYERELVKHGLDPADYSDMKEKLEGNKFFDRTYTYRTNREINNFLTELAVVMNEISDQRAELCYRTPCKECSWDCKEFQELCIMDYKGLDTEEYIRHTYIRGGSESGDDMEFFNFSEEGMY